ncbi:MAG: M20/M25/M40 family metallo-hydrolase [Sandaracinaceae bacterium]
MTSASNVATRAKKNHSRTLARLTEYLTIPAISCDASRAADVRRLAEKIRDDLGALGMDDARLLELDGAHPAVAAERMRAGADKPTLLIYGHLDLQPVAGEAWSTAPHEAVEKDGRLYARGAADDMGGWVSHLAAIEAWLEEVGELPLNVRLLIEGEEEIGSPNLERYMDAYPEAFASDVMVLTDCENPSSDVPGLTVSLRGLLEIEVRCDALGSDVHSGLWGNLVPDPCIALMQIVSRLVDQNGRLTVGRVELTDRERDAYRNVPLGEDVIRRGARILPDVAPLPLEGRTPAEWAWRQPAITVLSTTFPAPGTEKNAVRRSASAKLSCRVAPGQSSDALFQALRDAIVSDPPGGVRVSVEQLRGGDGWLYEPKGPAFPAADRAYQAAWGKPLSPIGVGGSIPFVAMFGRRFAELPLILNGVMDPETGAHGPDESMHLGVFEKAIAANVYLYDELARVEGLGKSS